MNTFTATETEFTPLVILNPAEAKYLISGESRPENANKFYEPLLNWFLEFKKEAKDKKIDFEFKFVYFNSTSAKYIMDLLKQFDTLYSEGYPISVRWFYDPEDEDMKESGEEFAKLVKIPIELVKE